MEKKYFTLDEANQMIPFVKTQVEDLRGLKDQIQQKVNEFEDQGVDVGNIFTTDELSEDEKQARADVENIADEINTIVMELKDQGVLLKDIEQGLVDFYCQIGGSEVFLCWQYGEPEIEYYHAVGEGFAGRKSLFQRDILENVTQVH